MLLPAARQFIFYSPLCSKQLRMFTSTETVAPCGVQHPRDGCFYTPLDYIKDSIVKYVMTGFSCGTQHFNRAFIIHINLALVQLP